MSEIASVISAVAAAVAALASCATALVLWRQGRWERNERERMAYRADLDVQIASATYDMYRVDLRNEGPGSAHNIHLTVHPSYYSTDTNKGPNFEASNDTEMKIKLLAKHGTVPLVIQWDTGCHNGWSVLIDASWTEVTGQPRTDEWEIGPT